MKKLLSLVTLFMCGVHCNVNAQATATTDNAPSSNFTNNNSINNSLSGTGGGGSSAYNVDMFSGTANINIPIYNYSVDGIDAGISLSYNTGGIRVDQLASSIGLGWNLNAGASITREVNGLEDEATVPALGPWQNTNPPIPRVPQMSGAWGFKNPETDYDKFTINFGNSSVDFILQFVPVPSGVIGPYQPFLVGTSGNTNLHILPLVNGQSVYSAAVTNSNSNNTYRFDPSMETQQATPQILSFQVTDEYGNQYFFDRGDYEYKPYVDTTANPRVTFMYYPVDKWNLTKLITWKGTTITYKYRHFDYISYPLQRSVIMKEVREYNSTDIVYNANYDVLPHTQLLTDSIIYWKGTLSEISEIDYPNGVVATFNTPSAAFDRLDLSGAYAIQNITLESKYDANVDNKLMYQFNQAYFTTTANTEQPVVSGAYDPFGYRLKLTGIDRYGTDLTTFEPYYRFTYNTNVVLPQRCSPAQDLYGYYNGVSTGSTTFSPTTGQASWVVNGLSNSANFLPSHTFTYLYNSLTYSVTYGLSKSNNINNAQACLLTSMTNGLGGTTSFAYKDHVLTNPPGDIFTWTGTTTTTTAGTFPDYTFTGPHYYADGRHGTEIPSNNNPSLNMEGSDVNDGVCIDNITTTDGFNPDNNTFTQYTYAGGMRFFPGGYYWYPTVAQNYPTTLYLPESDGSTSLVEESWRERIYTNSIVSSMELINGANHGYSDVTATTYGANSEQVSSHRVLFTNVISQPNEFDSLIYLNPPTSAAITGIPELPNTSRIQASCGIFQHTMPRLFMDKHTIGLPVEIDDYDKNSTLMHQTTNLYTEHSVGYGTVGTGHGTPLYNLDYPARSFGVNQPTDGSAGGSTLHYYYLPFSESVALLKTSTSTDFSASLPLSTTKNYFYDQHNHLLQTTWTDSKGELNYTSNGNTYTYIGSLDFDSVFVFHNLGTGTYKALSYSPYWGTVNGSGIDEFYYFPPGGSMNYSVPYYRISDAFTYRLSSSAGPVISDYKYYTQYDGQNNVVETWYKNKQEVYSALWDTRIGQKVASVVNSAYTDMAYTSFEGAFTAGLDSNKGHWNFDQGNVAYDPASKPITGKYYYNVNSAIISEYPLVSGKSYYLSFWMQGSPNVQTTGAHPSSLAVTGQNTVNGWTLYTGYITGTGTTISVGSVGAAKLDELRLHPADATMETFTYEPLLGVSSHCDDRNNVTYMQYDVQGRPYITRDINGNIIKLTKQVNQGNDN